jgi:hypothetical protein
MPKIFTSHPGAPISIIPVSLSELIVIILLGSNFRQRDLFVYVLAWT